MVDLSTNGNNATLINAPAFTPAYPKYFSFNGNNQYIYTASNQFYNPFPFTIAVWFRTVVSTGCKIIGFENNQFDESSNTFDRHMYVGRNGYLYFGIFQGFPLTTVISATPD